MSIRFVKFVSICICGVLLNLQAAACTLVLVSGKATADGRPLLLKNRDSSDAPLVEMRVEKDEGFAYLAQFAVADSIFRGPWCGYNEKGFAIGNSLSFNLKEDQGMGGNGEILRKGLALCETVDDFEQVLKGMEKPMDVMANFAVFDAYGAAAIFEVGKSGYVKYDANDLTVTRRGVLIRSNYSISGNKSNKIGEDRYVIASRYLQARPVGSIVWQDLLLDLSRLLVNSEGIDLRDASPASYAEETRTDFDGFIPRDISTNAMVIQGVKSGESPLLTSCWTMVGPPMMTVALPVFLSEELPAKTVSDGEGAWLCQIGRNLKDVVFAYPDAPRVIDLSKLYNGEETGVMQKIIRMEEIVIARGELLMQEFRDSGVLSPSSLHSYYEWLDLYLDDAYSIAFGRDEGDESIDDISTVMKGDLNLDNQVDITDVTILVDFVLKGVGVDSGITVGVPMEADINNDGTVSIADVTTVVEMILGN